jgi:hypothetical protein
MARRRKEERRVGIASRGIVRQLGRFTSRVRHRVVPDRDRVPDRCNTSGSAVDVCMTLSHECNGLSARRMAVWYTWRAPSLCRHVHCEFMRSALLDLTPIIAATTCNQRNYVERYSRFKGKKQDAPSGQPSGHLWRH